MLSRRQVVMKQGMLTAFKLEDCALILQQWPLHKQTGCEQTKDMEESH